MGIKVTNRFRLWRALLIAMVLLITAVIGYEIKSTPPAYLESATVVFSPPATLVNPVSTASLITTGEVMVQSMMSTHSQRLVFDVGGISSYSLTLVNSSDQEYPEYSFPLAILTAESTNPIASHRTFTTALRLLRKLVLKRQAKAGVPLRSRFSIEVVGDNGPVAQLGSSKRALAAFALLAVIAMSIVSRSLDRHHAGLAKLLERRKLHQSPAMRSGRHSRSRGRAGSLTRQRS